MKKDRITFGEPCGQRWADMPARGAGRYCALCDQTVTDMSRLTEREALARIRGGTCGRVLLDESGAPVFKREPQRVGVRALAVLGALAGGCASGGSAERAELVEADDEPPVEAAGALMMPVGEEPVPEGVAVDDLPGELVASYDERLAALRDSVEPTDEQRRLTQAKRRRRTPAVSVHHQQVFMGMMVMPDDY